MQTRPEPSDEVVDVVLAASRILVGIADRALPETSDVTLHQFRVLALLDGGGALNVNDLAHVLGVSPSTVTRLCDRLVHKRLIHRRHGRNNRREVSIGVSPTGAALVAEVLGRRRQALGVILARLDGLCQEELARALGAFVEASGEQPDALLRLG